MLIAFPQLQIVMKRNTITKKIFLFVLQGCHPKLVSNLPVPCNFANNSITRDGGHETKQGTVPNAEQLRN
jgi:hypothetical protein